MTMTNHIELNTAEQSPVEKLPDEILEIIFLLNTLKGLEVAPVTHDLYRTTLSTLLVCKRWHDVAINYPALWSRIIDYERHPPSLVNELLRRSKSSLIDVGEDSVFKCVQLRTKHSKDTLVNIFQQAWRLRTLSIQIRLEPWGLICQHFLQYPAPKLEYLNLVTSCPFPDCLFPDPLFAGDAPHLKRVHLKRCLIDFSSTSLSNLTELSVLDIVAPRILSLRQPDHPLKVAPTVAGWLRILQNIPSLQYLTLSAVITPSEDSQPLNTVHLPNLVYLTLGADFHDGVTLLDHLSIPRECGMRIKLSAKTSLDSDGARLMLVLSNQLSRWTAESPDRYLQAKILSATRIHFGNSKRVGYIWDLTEADVIAEHSLTSADPLVWLILSLDSAEDTITLFNQLLSLYAPTYPTTTTLDLWIDEDFANMVTNPVTFPALSILQSFSALRTLNLLERSPLYLLPLFRQSSSPDHPLFPALSSLRLTKTIFDGDNVAYQTIIDFLLWRIHVQRPLTALQIIEGKITEKAKDDLWRIGGVAVMFGSLGSKAKDYSLRAAPVGASGRV